MKAHDPATGPPGEITCLYLLIIFIVAMNKWSVLPKVQVHDKLGEVNDH